MWHIYPSFSLPPSAPPCAALPSHAVRHSNAGVHHPSPSVTPTPAATPSPYSAPVAATTFLLRAQMASSPQSVTSTLRSGDEQPVVSGLGLSGCSGGSESLASVGDPEVDSQRRAGPWEQPPPTKKELWQRRRDER